MNDEISLQITQIKLNLQDFYNFTKTVMRSMYDQNVTLVRRINELEERLRQYEKD